MLLKKIVLFLLMLTVIVSTAGCSSTAKGDNAGSTASSVKSASSVSSASSTVPTESGKVFSKPTKISIMIASHASWPYNPDWKIWDYIEDATGAELDIQAVNNGEYKMKINLMLAAKEQLPDLLHIYEKASYDAHALDGAFVSILDNLDKAPVFSKWLDTIDGKKELLDQRTSGDGKVYSFPTYGLHTINNMKTWMYRKDIFDKNGLSTPKTYDELYQVSKKLKELYPDSYPFCLRFGSNVNFADLLGPQWKPYLTQRFYYDFLNKKMSYGAIEDTMKDLIAFMNKMYKEELIIPDYVTMNSKRWQEVVTTNKGFIMTDYIVRIDYFNLPARKIDPNYTWATFAPPKGNSSTATNLLPKENLEMSGYLVCNTGDEEKVNNAFKFVDWMYTEEGKDLLSWGKEGETYKVENGEKKFILDEKGTAVNLLYGIGTYGTYQAVDVAANEAQYSKENVTEAHKAIDYLIDKSNPITWWLPLNQEETEIKSGIATTLDTYCNEQLTKFLLGQRPLTEWNAYVEEAKKLGVDKVLETYDAAYKRVMTNK